VGAEVLIGMTDNGEEFRDEGSPTGFTYNGSSFVIERNQ